MKKTSIKLTFASILAGIVNGLFGTGGGMVLVPLITKLTDLEDEEVFPASISIILPMCVISLCITAVHSPLPFTEALPYLLGSAAGGIIAGKYGIKIPKLWLHRLLGLLIVWGGFRYLWQ